MDGFEGKVAVVTGGASGIGAGIAKALASEGARLVLADLDGDRAKALADTLPGAGHVAVPTDVRETASVDALAGAVETQCGGLDLLVNNAGVYLGGPMRDVTEDDWRFVLDVNLDGVFRVGQRFVPMLRARGSGHVVNTASVGGMLSYGGAVAYAVSKFGVVAYSEALRSDLEPDGIGVSTLCPGAIATDLPSSDRYRAAGERAGGRSEALQPFIEGGMDPDAVGPIVLRGIRRNLPYIFTDDAMRELFQQRFDTILAGFDALAGTEA